MISWLYQSPILTDRAFARPYTKADLVTKLMGAAYMEKGWAARSLTALATASRRNLREDEAGRSAVPVTEKRANSKAPVRDSEEASDKRMSLLDPGAIRYGFGIHVGRDGLEHLGIDRIKRGGERSGRGMVLYEEQRRSFGE
jgi:hypothetical protein